MSKALVHLPKDPPRTQFAESINNLWTMFVKMRGNLAPNTVDWYYRVGRKFIHFFHDKELTPENMAAWVRYLQDCKKPGYDQGTLSPRRINAINVRIRSFLKFLHRHNYIHTPLWECITWQVAPQPKAPEAITEAEYERLKAYMAGKDCYQCLLWLCILAYRTGMSLIDCCHLRWKDVHLDDNGPSYIDIYRQKTRRLGEKARCQIPILPGTDIHQWLLELRKAENYKRADGIDDYVHQDAPGEYSYNGYRMRIPERLGRVFRNVGIHGKSFKHFRNSLVSALVNSGTPYPIVCKITGHGSVHTLLKYLKTDHTALQDGMMKAYEYTEAQKEG